MSLPVGGIFGGLSMVAPTDFLVWWVVALWGREK